MKIFHIVFQLPKKFEHFHTGITRAVKMTDLIISVRKSRECKTVYFPPPP